MFHCRQVARFTGPHTLTGMLRTADSITGDASVAKCTGEAEFEERRE